MKNPNEDSGYNIYNLKCPYCGDDECVDYEDFPEGNGNTSEAYCSNCEKTLITQVDYIFRIRTVQE